jgi:RNA ligase-like protein
MLPYGKTQNLHPLNMITKKRDRTVFTNPEFEYLKDNIWIFTEKIDGTNMRVIWDGKEVEIRGRSDNANFPGDLRQRMVEIFTPEKMLHQFDRPACLYGEGYGGGIQSGGKYRPDKDFILFDILIGDYWLERENVVDVGRSLQCEFVPEVTRGPLADGVRLVEGGLHSLAGTEFGTGTPEGFIAEGLIARPTVGLFNRHGERVQVKIKDCDFR